MHTFCYDKEATLRPGEIYWPRKAWLNELSKIIRRFSSLHLRGGNELWSCVKAIDNRRSALKLSRTIERLVDRAAKLRNEPAAFAIQRQAIAGNRAAHRCFAALERCHHGKSTFASEDWEQFREILQPRSDETCEAKASQILADWWRDDLSPEKPWDDLALWLSTIGNPSLAAKLVGPNSPYFFYATLSEHGNRRRSKALAAMRQQEYRRRKNHPIRLSLMRILSTPAKPSRAVRAKK